MKPMDMQKIQNLTRCSGFMSNSSAPKLPLVRLSCYPVSIINQILPMSLHTYRKLENTVVRIRFRIRIIRILIRISGHRW